MTLAHNLLIRGLNSIHCQAPHVKPTEQLAFVGYAQNFVNVLKVHHACEEETFFAEVERMAGESGIMEKNVEEHHAFHGGLDTLDGYLAGVARGAEAYNGGRIVEIIDDFGPALSEHLREEIQTLLELKRFGPERMKGLADALIAEGKANLVSDNEISKALDWDSMADLQCRTRLASQVAPCMPFSAMTRRGRMASGQTSRPRRQDSRQLS